MADISTHFDRRFYLAVDAADKVSCRPDFALVPAVVVTLRTSRRREEIPAALFATGEGDTRVPPQQAVKMAAKVRWASGSGLRVLLRFDRKSGHAGGRIFDERIADTAAEQAFLLHELGVAVMPQTAPRK